MPEREHRGHQESSIRYPKELVHRYGAKGGILKYIAQELPDIPQSPMIVSEPGEATEDILSRADAAGIRYPRIFRSSAIAELAGYEGDFDTETLDSYEVGHDRVKWNRQNYSLYRNPEYFEQGVRETVDRVRFSSRRFQHQDPSLPDEINVIIAEKSPSEFVGTGIRLPNQDGAFLASVTDLLSSEYWRTKEDYLFRLDEGIHPLTKVDEYMAPHDAIVREQLLQVFDWHDRIAQLPLMDPSWAYQIEFGVKPLCLYQVRPLLPLGKADFTLPRSDVKVDSTPVVIGVTPPEGINLRVVKYPDFGYRNLAEVDYQGEGLLFDSDLKQGHEAERLPNVRAVFLSRYKGLLAHGEIRLMRSADVTVLFPINYLYLQDGEVVNLKSDGVSFEIQKAE